MTAKKQRHTPVKKDVHPLSHAMGDLCRACFSFPTPGDITWKISHPKHRDPKKAHNGEHEKAA